MKPGDIVKTLSGKTVEVQNTDAEGRLILADGLAYAMRYKPATLIDIATLTGACVVALGQFAIGMFGTNQALKDQVRKAGQTAGERVWEMPLLEEYFEQLESDVADMRNIGGRGGGMITAALFLVSSWGTTRGCTSISPVQIGANGNGPMFRKARLRLGPGYWFSI